MSFVGTRPEATKYVEKYSNEMLATLLLPAGMFITLEIWRWHVWQSCGLCPGAYEI